MEVAFTFLIAAVVWWSFFQAIRLGAIDPHHVEAAPGHWMIFAQSALAFLALLLLTGAKQAQPDFAPFLAMFVLAQVVAPAFTSPDRLRADEEPSALMRWAESAKSSTSGAVLMKVLSIVLAQADPGGRTSAHPQAVQRRQMKSCLASKEKPVCSPPTGLITPESNWLDYGEK